MDKLSPLPVSRSPHTVPAMRAQSPRAVKVYALAQGDIVVAPDAKPVAVSACVSEVQGTRTGQPAHITRIQVPPGEEAALRERANVICSCAPHVNVVCYHAWTQADRELLLVSDTLERVPLDAVIGKLSLWERINLATQIVVGMNWLLTNAEPISHGNLGPRHLLLSDNNRVLSVAHYGLPRAVWGPGKPASPYAAPDAALTEASDVYSFGVILHQLVTGQAVARVPLVFEDDFPLEMRSLVQSCVGAAGARPTFPQIIEGASGGSAKSARVLVAGAGLVNPKEVRFGVFWQAAVEKTLGFDALGQQVWQHAGLFGVDRVPEALFVNVLKIVVGVTDADMAGPGWSSFWRLVNADSGTVTMADFAQVLHWFGPLSDRGGFFVRIAQLTQHDWFHGALPREPAERLLAGHARDGGWLVRFGSVPGTYTLCVIHKKKDGWSVANYRIFRTHNGFTVDEKRFCASLEELLSAMKKEAGLAKVVPCTRFVLEKIVPGQAQMRPGGGGTVTSEYVTGSDD